MVRYAPLVALFACNSNAYHTHAFTAPTSCGQGPYDVHIPADGTTAEDGIEVVACTPRQLAGHVEMSIGSIGMSAREFGDGSADNQRCVGGPAVVAQLGSGSPSAVASGGAAGSATANAPVLVEQVFTGDESAWGDDLCKPYGVAAQTLMIPTTMGRTTGWNLIEHGTDLHVRIWSDVPNDLSGVTFLVREVMSTDKPQAPKPVKPDQEPHAKREVAEATPPPPPPHGPPPAPLAEEKPARTADSATWVPGYWKWTGTDWGWVAGFWRDAADMPAPRVETPGAAPQVGAIWIGGTWRRSAGGWSWIGGRWRER
jgi:hypothetical protein